MPLPTNFLSEILVTINFPVEKKIIMSSKSEHSEINSSFLKDHPTKPSSLLMYNFLFETITFDAEILSKTRISVFLSFLR